MLEGDVGHLVHRMKKELADGTVILAPFCVPMSDKDIVRQAVTLRQQLLVGSPIVQRIVYNDTILPLLICQRPKRPVEDTRR